MKRLLAALFLAAACGSAAILHGRADAPVLVKAIRLDQPISFKRDVMPILTKAGCNTGGCHGSARGQDGFHLSLFGYDPAGDYDRITREMGARRVNLALPEESLLLQKATGSVAHTGGKRFGKESEFYRAIVQWLDAGAPRDPADLPTPVSVEMTPSEILLEGENATRQVAVTAHYSDGMVRDVTPLAVFFTNNEGTAKISPAGLVTSGARGEAFVMARFATTTVGTPVIVVPKGLAYTFPPVAERNYVDTLVDAKLKKLRILPSEVCTDEEFLRRVTLDITGLLPTGAEYSAFLASAAADKREKWIDELLTRPGFVDMWVMKWAELLRIRSGLDVSQKSALVYFNWLRGELSQNVPVNQIVRKLIDSDGGVFENPAAGFYQFETDPLKLAEDTAQAFLGVQVKCAQCHNHPFDRWTMNDYRGFVAFFTQIARKKGEDPREIVVYDRHEGESKNPITFATLPPKFLGGATPDVAGRDRRAVLADWMSSPQNPYFAKHFANILWAQFFGRGIVEPVDDVRVSNPPSNTALLDALASHFVAYNYDLKHLVRDICNSRTYQLSSISNDTNASDVRNFSHSQVRRLRAEVMLDCISQVTDTKTKFKGMPLGARAVQIADGDTTSYFLRTFGRATRETPCTCEVSMEPNLSQALHLLNGDTVEGKIAKGALIQKMLVEKKTAHRHRRRPLPALFLPEADRRRDQQPRAPLREGRHAEEDAGGCLLGAPELEGVHVQPLMKAAPPGCRCPACSRGCARGPGDLRGYDPAAVPDLLPELPQPRQAEGGARSFHVRLDDGRRRFRQGRRAGQLVEEPPIPAPHAPGAARHAARRRQAAGLAARPHPGVDRRRRAREKRQRRRQKVERARAGGRRHPGEADRAAADAARSPAASPSSAPAVRAPSRAWRRAHGRRSSPSPASGRCSCIIPRPWN